MATEMKKRHQEKQHVSSIMSFNKASMKIIEKALLDDKRYASKKLLLIAEKHKEDIPSH